MTHMVTITAKDLKGMHVRLAEHYVCTEHWALHRAYIMNSNLLLTDALVRAYANPLSVDTVDNGRIGNLFPKKNNLRVKWDGEIFSPDRSTRPQDDLFIFTSDKHLHVGFKRPYVKFLDLTGQELAGDTPLGAFTNEGRTLLVMPVKLPERAD